jgi:hypothetical protein
MCPPGGECNDTRFAGSTDSNCAPETGNYMQCSGIFREAKKGGGRCPMPGRGGRLPKFNIPFLLHGQLGAARKHPNGSPLVLLRFGPLYLPNDHGPVAGGPAPETDALNQPPFRRCVSIAGALAPDTECGNPYQGTLRRKYPFPSLASTRCGQANPNTTPTCISKFFQFTIHSRRSQFSEIVWRRFSALGKEARSRGFLGCAYERVSSLFGSSIFHSWPVLNWNLCEAYIPIPSTTGRRRMRELLVSAHYPH